MDGKGVACIATSLPSFFCSAFGSARPESPRRLSIQPLGTPTGFR